MAEYMILIHEGAPAVKELAFFLEQGGDKDDWGKKWQKCTANNLYEARAIAIQRRREKFPHAYKVQEECGARTEDIWPEAKGQ